MKPFPGTAERKTYRLIPLLTPVIFRETVPLRISDTEVRTEMDNKESGGKLETVRGILKEIPRPPL